MASAFIQIVTIQPEGYQHSGTFAELAETLREAFLALGTRAEFSVNTFDPSAINLVLGWHLLGATQEAALPESCILYNLEQMDDRNKPLRARLVRLSKRCELWDYSRRNIDILHQAGVEASIHHVPIGTMPALSRIPRVEPQDIDVLFYGSLNPRRKAILEALEAEGLRVQVLFGVYGMERDRVIARAKIVLNLHYYDTSILEMVRVSYLWANRKAVVAECHAATEIPKGLEAAARFVPYDHLVAACKELAEDPEARSALESRGFELMAQRVESEILQHVLAGEAEILPGDFETPEAPVCSLVIPVFNKVEYTQQCVDALLETTPTELFETIFIDNASTDETATYLAGLSGRVKVITNTENLGFVDACNQGAAVASGKYLVFLNNDTAPMEGWLEALLALAESDETIGAVGAKLVYPDGRLQEAGGIIFSDGTGWNFGRFGDPFDPAHLEAVEVDYCSGAALLVRRELFEQLNGFDRRYAPAYYEDTDLCFSIRAAGQKVVFCPTSIVVHFEGITAGTDLDKGFKRFQAINRRKFVAKWKAELRHQDPPPFLTGRKPVTADRRRLGAPRPHVLIVDPFLPMHDRASGSLRLFRIILILWSLNCKITYIARNGINQERYKRQLESLGVKVYATDPEKMAQLGHTCTAEPVDLGRILRENPCTVAWLSFYDIAEQYLPEIRAHSPGTMIMVDSVDVHFLRETRQAELSGDAEALARAQRTRERELKIYSQADRVITVTEADAAVLKEAGLMVPTEVIPNIHFPEGEAQGWEGREGMVFVGNFNHTPNIDAAVWLCREIFPKVQAQIPEIRLAIIGPNAPKEVKDLVNDHIQVLGWVPETAPHLDAARVSVAPLRVGAGMKGKVGEALSRGLPVVTTSIGAEGMGLENGRHVLVADDAVAFALAVVRLHGDRDAWEAMAREGREFINETYGMGSVGVVLSRLVTEPLPGKATGSTVVPDARPSTACHLCGRSAHLLMSEHVGYQDGTRFAIYECPWCEVQFTHPQDVPDEIYEHIYRNASILPGYARYFGYAAEIMKEADPLSWLAEREDVFWFLKHAIRELALTPEDTVIEVGSGLGYLTYALRKAGIASLGVDVSMIAVEQATRTFGPYYRAIAAELLAEEQPRQASVVVLTEMIEHVKEPEKLLHTLARLLKPGGTILLTTPNKSAHPMGVIWDTENPPVHLWWFSEATLRGMAARLDMDIRFFDFSGFNARRFPGLTVTPLQSCRPAFLAANGGVLRTQEECAQEPTPPTSPSALALHFLVQRGAIAFQRSDSMGVILNPRVP